MTESIVNWIDGGVLNTWVLGSAWIWPTMETLHFVGLSLMLGALLIIDLRLAGFFRKINIAATHKLLPWVFIGFGINLTTGVLFFFGDPGRYAINIGFRFKMMLIVLAGLNALWFYWKINPVMRSWEPDCDTPAVAKTIAWISLGSWFGVLLLGRLIPYVGTG